VIVNIFKWVTIFKRTATSDYLFICKQAIATLTCDNTDTDIILIVVDRAVPNILFVFYSGRIVGRIVYSYSAE